MIGGFKNPIFTAWHHSPFNVRTLPPIDRDKIVSISKWQRDQLYKKFGIKFPVVYSGIRREIFPDLEFEKEDNLYLFLARCSSSKAPHIIMRMADKYPDCHFIILGELIFTNEPYYGFMLQKEASRRKNVNFWCNLDNNYELKLEYLKKASGLIHPSIIDEPFSINFIEAFRYNTPVYTWNRGAFPEIVDSRTGMLIKREGYSPTEEEIEAYISEFETFRNKSFKSNSFKSKINKFNLENTAKRYIKLFESSI
jgi:glycosyltransferase involved in cell wall biosynthesis